jgi:hypothetical protein
MTRRLFLESPSIAIGAVGAARAVEDAPTFRRPKVILPVPTPSPKFQHLQAGVPDTQLTRGPAPKN